MKKVGFIVLGAGSRGSAYSKYALANPDKMEIVGVAEPAEARRIGFQEQYSIPEENVVADWRPLMERPKFADAVIIATQDQIIPRALETVAPAFRIAPRLSRQRITSRYLQQRNPAETEPLLIRMNSKKDLLTRRYDDGNHSI